MSLADARHARVFRDLVLLSAACAAMYLPGLTARGLINWQEAQRALVAREMHARGEWIVPTVNGEPYLAKPPLIYWCQLALAAVRGGEPTETDLRLTVAVAGWLGVMATYFVARRLLDSAAGTDGGDDFPRHAAFWSALFLASGVLYVRRSRIGELDILLVPFTVVAIGALFHAWRVHITEGRTHWRALGIATLAGAGAALAKGPPGLLAIAVGGYGGMVLVAVQSRGVREEDLGIRRALVALGAIGFAGGGLISTWGDSGPTDRVIGPILLAAIGGICGDLLARLRAPGVVGDIWRSLKRAHPVAVLGLPLIALWAWLWAARNRIGAAPVLTTIEAEAKDNLRLFVLDAPLNNLEAAAYGVGIGSLAAMVGAVWLLRRPRLGPGMAFCIAWAGLCLIAFSVLGKGVQRYLTPVWPAVAMVGGSWFAWRGGGALAPNSITRVVVIAGVVALAASQAVWYGTWGARQDLTPREFIADLLEPGRGVDPARLGTFEFATPQIDYYVGRRVESFTDAEGHPDLLGVGPRTIVDLVEQLRHEGGVYTLLIRRSQPSFIAELGPPLERVEAAGLLLEPIPLEHSFITDNSRTEIGAYRVRAR